MKIVIIVLIMINFLLTAPVYAMPASNQIGANTVKVEINGLVCDFCARALEKVFGKQETVSGIDVNLDDKAVTINFKDGQTLDDKTITKLINDAGYDVREIRRNE